MRNHWTEIEKYLEDQKIAQELIGELRDFHMRYEVEDQVKERVEKPDILFYGKKILEMSIAALLQGDNLLLSGAKATGKNVLCETLAWIFGRPEYDISFHVNTDSADLIGTDTFINNEVRLRKGPIYQCAEFGGFGILDEINMAKNDAVSVLHATLDHRRRIDIPGYNRILLHPATRFIGTMNYGYAGTRELNEALVSRFMVIDMPEMDEDSVLFVLRQHFPDGEKSALKTVCSSLMERPEKNKILIVLSDGKPCDMSIQRPGTRQPKIYDGEGAVKDTAYEVRRARNQGIFVIGIFVGNEEELSVEKRIYGKDFVYIRNISNFSRMVGTFLRRQIDME